MPTYLNFANPKILNMWDPILVTLIKECSPLILNPAPPPPPPPHTHTH